VTKGKTWHFVCDEERYGDKLLHCTVNVNQAKCFATTKEIKFYDPTRVPDTETNTEMNRKVEVIHKRFQHASVNEKLVEDQIGRVTGDPSQ
jgi:hypothetical protein